MAVSLFLTCLRREARVAMPLIQGGPPEWIWERTSDPLRCEVVSSQALDGQTVYELKVKCGLEIMRLQFFTEDEIKEVQAILGTDLPKGT
jgi:hypothetical protein